MLKVYGPYKNDRGYWFVNVFGDPKGRWTISYARFLLEQSGIDMNGKEADHIDGDIDHNELSNLAALPLLDHKLKHKRSRTFVDVICLWCKNPFRVELKIYNNNKKQRSKGFICCASCKGSYMIAKKLAKI